MIYWLIILLAVIPGLLISYLIYQQDRYDREPKLILLLCFVLGMISTVPAIWIESLASESGIEDSSSFLSLLVLSFVVVGFMEELVKFLCLMLFAFPRKAFNEPMDGIVYAVMVGMGFATLENIIYADRFGFETIVFRAFTAVPAHGVFAVITGYYAGLAKFNPTQRIPLLLKGFGLAVFIHGLYDFFILQEYAEWIMSLATLTLFVGLYFSIRMIRLHQINSPFRKGNAPLNNTALLDDQLIDSVIDDMSVGDTPKEDE